jgi:hypothetical protein
MDGYSMDIMRLSGTVDYAVHIYRPTDYTFGPNLDLDANGIPHLSNAQDATPDLTGGTSTEYEPVIWVRENHCSADLYNAFVYDPMLVPRSARGITVDMHHNVYIGNSSFYWVYHPTYYKYIEDWTNGVHSCLWP